MGHLSLKCGIFVRTYEGHLSGHSKWEDMRCGTQTSSLKLPEAESTMIADNKVMVLQF